MGCCVSAGVAEQAVAEVHSPEDCSCRVRRKDPRVMDT